MAIDLVQVLGLLMGRFRVGFGFDLLRLEVLRVSIHVETHGASDGICWF